MLNPSQTKLKARLLKLKARLQSYACHGKPNPERLDRSGAYAVAAGFFDGWGSLDKDGARFVENADKAGLRFVGFADEIAGRAVDHKGWFTNEFQDEVLRGVVLQLPARHGKPVFVAGYADPCNKGAYRIDSGLHIGDDSEGEEAKRDAAIAADEFARIAAEEERDYNESWQAGSLYARLGEEIANRRQYALELFAQMRKARATLNGTELPALCRTIREKIESIVERNREAREERAKLLDNRPTWNARLVSAWNDGAGL